MSQALPRYGNFPKVTAPRFLKKGNLLTKSFNPVSGGNSKGRRWIVEAGAVRPVRQRTTEVLLSLQGRPMLEAAQPAVDQNVRCLDGRPEQCRLPATVPRGCATSSGTAASDALAAVGLDHAAFNWQLSAGMQQGAAIARSITVPGCRMFIMEEPFARSTRKSGSDRVIVLAGRPASIADIVNIELGEERDQVTTRVRPEGGVYGKQILDTTRGR